MGWCLACALRKHIEKGYNFELSNGTASISDNDKDIVGEDPYFESSLAALDRKLDEKVTEEEKNSISKDGFGEDDGNDDVILMEDDLGEEVDYHPTDLDFKKVLKIISSAHFNYSSFSSLFSLFDSFRRKKLLVRKEGQLAPPTPKLITTASHLWTWTPRG